jgi:hypothetical protein
LVFDRATSGIDHEYIHAIILIGLLCLNGSDDNGIEYIIYGASTAKVIDRFVKPL